MKIVVTGSSGRLGTTVVRQLIATGNEVVPVDQFAATQGPATRVMSVCDYGAFRQAVEGANAICHLGNHPMISQDFDSVDKFVNNVRSNDVVFEAAFDAKIHKVVFASSIQAYGSLRSRYDRPNAYTTPLYFPIDEDHPLLPSEPYPLSKLVGEATAESFARRDPLLSAVSLRFTAIIHEKNLHWCRHGSDDKGWIGSSLATYVHTEDAARAVWLACKFDRPGHWPFNVVAGGSPCPWTSDDIKNVYGTVPPFKSKLEASQGLISPRRATEILGFTAELTPEGKKLSEFQKP